MLKIFFVFSLFVFSGCATYQSKVASAKSEIINKNCDGAEESLLQLSSEAGTDQLAYLMEFGTTLQICKKYEKSIQVLEQAEKLAEKIDYTSLSEVAVSTLLNEEFKSYKGDTFEKLFLNASKALNFIELNKYDEALIEVRKMNQKFDKFKGEDKKSFELNSFSKYLSGLIWEATGKYDDACIDYRGAFETNHTNSSENEIKHLSTQMLKACWLAERSDEFKFLAKKTNLTLQEITDIKKEKSKSELVVLFLKGWGPQKKENPVHPTFPYLVRNSMLTQKLKISITDQNQKELGQFISQPFYSVAEAARLSLETDQAPLIERRIAARVAKQVVADQIRQKNAELGLAALILMVGSEKADLRQWSFLPDSIHAIRVHLQPGSYTADVEGIGFNDTLTEKFESFTFTIEKKQKLIKSFRSLL